MARFLLFHGVASLFVISLVYANVVNGEERMKRLILSEFIKAGNLSAAKDASLVQWDRESIDGVPSYTGFITVNETTNSNLFFWFIPSVYEDPEDAPMILWLNGGPSTSSMFGLFVENGPLAVKRRRSRLVLRLRKDSWARKHSMLFIDSPVGTGFSFTDDEAGFSRNQEDITNNLYTALGQFFTVFSDFTKQDFYIAGESYAGKHVPHLGMRIHEENLKENATKINLKGFILGGPFTDPITITSQYSNYYYYQGLIDAAGRAYFKEQETLTANLIQEGKFEEAVNVNDALISGMFSEDPTYFYNQTGYEYLSNVLETRIHHKRSYYSKYLNSSSVRKIIHVGDQRFYNSSSKALTYLKADLFRSCKTELEQLLNLKYKVLIYVGQLDLVTPHTAVANFVQSMNFDDKAPFETAERRILRDKKRGDVAGYVKSAGNFTYVLLRRAGHHAPKDEPRWCREMVEKFIEGKDLA